MYRTEYDSLGAVQVEEDKLWKAQTQRSLIHFHIGHEKMPTELVQALIQIKKAYAQANLDFKKITTDQSQAIVQACDQLLDSNYMEHFPLSIWQTGSGTQSNMNANEVISTIAFNKTGIKVHPNDHVNASQSSNDVFPSAIHVMAYHMLNENLLPQLKKIMDVLRSKQEELYSYIKLGRTHLQDATPMKVGQELGAYLTSITYHYHQLKACLDSICELALGATAVGTGINCPKGLASKACKYLGKHFRSSTDLFWSLSYKDVVTNLHGRLKELATSLYKMANDLRLLASGPRAGLAEYQLPANEPGSSIMPGKVNPTQCEALTMVCVRVIGNDTTLAIANSQGQFQLNTMMPLIAYTLNQSLKLLSDSIHSFNQYALKDLKVNQTRLEKNVNESLMLITILSPEIGYEKASQVAHYAHKHNCTLIKTLTDLEVMDEESAKRKLNANLLIPDE